MGGSFSVQTFVVSVVRGTASLPKNADVQVSGRIKKTVMESLAKGRSGKPTAYLPRPPRADRRTGNMNVESF